MIFINCLRQYNEFMLSQNPAQVPVKYVSVQCKGGGGGAIAVLYGTVL